MTTLPSTPSRETATPILTGDDLRRHYADVRSRLMRPTLPKRTLLLSPPPECDEPSTIPAMDDCPLNMLAPPSWRFLVAFAAARGGVSPRDIIGPMRSKPVAAARHDAAYLMHQHLGWSTPQIGRKLGGRDHTTVLNSLAVQRKKLEAA